MAYGLKYTTGNIIREGVTYEMRIYQRDYAGDALEIGDLQALGVEVQGASVGVDAPIVKTLLHWTVADSSDIGTVAGVKHGGWEEFYTPDATLYLVRLLRAGVIVWSGYITPDSWSDNLVYTGSVTVTARDNIGHLRDFEFDKAALLAWMAYLGSDSVERVRDDNLVSIYELLFAGAGIASIDMPIRKNWDEDDPDAEPHLIAGEDADVLDWLVDVDALLEMNWYEVWEKVLASAGLCIRWCGKDGLYVMSLRSLHKMGGTTPPEFAANFVNRSGHRTLDPAYKRIVERLDYEAAEGYAATWGQGDFVVIETTIDGMVRYVSYLSLTAKWTQHSDSREVVRYADPTQRGMSDVAGETEKYVMVAGRPAEAPPAPVGPSDTYAKRIAYIDLSNYVTSPGKRLSPNTIVTVGFDVAHSYSSAGASTGYNFLSSWLPAGSVRYAITWRKYDGTYLSLQENEWVSGVNIREVAVPQGTPDALAGGIPGNAEAISVSDTFQTPDEPGYLELRLYPFRIDVYASSMIADWLDAHVRVGNISFDINSEAVPRYFKTTTIYDDSQNFTLKRDVDFGAVPTRYPCAGTILNGFYIDDKNNGYPSIMDCHWDGEETELPLPVLNHLQILSLHAKANNVLTGELRDAAGTPITWNGNWTYAGRTFLLISGVWNILTGRIQDAVLREFDTYEDAIGSIEVNYTTDLSGGDARIMALQKSVNAAASLARNGAGGSPSSGGTVTSVGLSIDTYFDITGSPVTGAGTLQAALKSTYKIPSTTEWSAVDNVKHSHSNKSVLDDIDSTKVGQWDAAYTTRHTHGNKSLLDAIDSTVVGQWNAAYDYAHTHSNYAALESITAAKVQAWDAGLSGDTVNVSIAGSNTAPTVKVALGTGSNDDAALPVADTTHAGIVDTGEQAFAGAKTFTRIYLGNSKARGMYIEYDDTARAFKFVGDLYATGDIAAGS